MPVHALIVDLDNTLVPEMANYEQAFDDGCRAIADELRLDVAELRRSIGPSPSLSCQPTSARANPIPRSSASR